MALFIFSTLFISTFFFLIDSDAVVSFYLQVYSHEIFQLYLPWICSIVAFTIIAKIVSGVRMRKEGVVIIALFMQLFSPVPYVDQGSKVEQVEIKKSRKKDSDSVLK